MKFNIPVGTTSKIVNLFIQDSTRGNGAGLSGLVFNSSGLVCSYYREGDSITHQVTLASASLGTYTSGGFVAVDGTNMPGLYQFGIPNAALATGAKSVVFMLSGAANMVPQLFEVQLVAYDPNNSTNLNLSALPSVAAGTAGGILVNVWLAGTVNDVSPTATSFIGTSFSSTDNFYQGSILVFTSGSLQGIARKIGSYVGATQTFTLATALPQAPSNGDAFTVIGTTE